MRGDIEGLGLWAPPFGAAQRKCPQGKGLRPRGWGPQRRALMRNLPPRAFFSQTTFVKLGNLPLVPRLVCFLCRSCALSIARFRWCRRAFEPGIYDRSGYLACCGRVAEVVAFRYAQTAYRDDQPLWWLVPACKWLLGSGLYRRGGQTWSPPLLV